MDWEEEVIAYVIMLGGNPHEVHLVEEDAVLAAGKDGLVIELPLRHRVLIGTEKGVPTSAIMQSLLPSIAFGEVLGRNGTAQE